MLYPVLVECRHRQYSDRPLVTDRSLWYSGYKSIYEIEGFSLQICCRSFRPSMSRTTRIKGRDLGKCNTRPVRVHVTAREPTAKHRSHSGVQPYAQHDGVLTPTLLGFRPLLLGSVSICSTVQAGVHTFTKYQQCCPLHCSPSNRRDLPI